MPPTDVELFSDQGAKISAPFLLEPSLPLPSLKKIP
jgi:hypothetical protein